jgi:organic hydroperoxide reductase OsmC/OhrA
MPDGSEHCGTYTVSIEWTRNATRSVSKRRDIEAEEAFVAAISNGHLRRFIDIAATFGYVVAQYSDTAEGRIATNDAGKPSIAHVVLQPAILFTGAKAPTDAAVLALHCAAHAERATEASVNAHVETVGVGVWHYERFLGED